MNDEKLIISQNEQLKAQNKALQKELRDLQKRYKYLEEQHEVRLNEYDELLQRTPEHIPDCQNCENDILLRNSELETENEKLKNKIRILNNDR